MLKKTFGELINLLVGAILIISLLMAGYLIFANVYHAQELQYDYYINDEGKTKRENIVKKIDDADNRLSTISFTVFGVNNKAIYYEKIRLGLKICTDEFKKMELYKTPIETADAFTNYTYYKDFNSFRGECLAYQMGVIRTTASSDLYEDEKMVSTLAMYQPVIYQITASNTVLENWLMGNSSYSYTTVDTRNTIYNPTKVIYERLLDNYEQSANILDEIVDYLEEVRATATTGEVTQ